MARTVAPRAGERSLASTNPRTVVTAPTAIVRDTLLRVSSSSTRPGRLVSVSPMSIVSWRSSGAKTSTRPVGSVADSASTRSPSLTRTGAAANGACVCSSTTSIVSEASSRSAWRSLVGIGSSVGAGISAGLGETSGVRAISIGSAASRRVTKTTATSAATSTAPIAKRPASEATRALRTGSPARSASPPNHSAAGRSRSSRSRNSARPRRMRERMVSSGTSSRSAIAWTSSSSRKRSRSASRYGSRTSSSADHNTPATSFLAACSEAGPACWAVHCATRSSRSRRRPDERTPRRRWFVMTLRNHGRGERSASGGDSSAETQVSWTRSSASQTSCASRRATRLRKACSSRGSRALQSISFMQRSGSSGVTAQRSP